MSAEDDKRRRLLDDFRYFERQLREGAPGFGNSATLAALLVLALEVDYVDHSIRLVAESAS